jgi:hypothetical protein
MFSGEGEKYTKGAEQTKLKMTGIGNAIQNEDNSQAGYSLEAPRPHRRRSSLVFNVSIDV